MSFLSKACVFLVALLSLYSGAATAATIDEFLVQASVSSPETAGGRTSIHTAHSRALGGGRTLTAINLNGSLGQGVTRVETKAAGGELGITVGSHRGRGVVLWNGDADPNSTSRSGLGGLDLTQDGGDSFTLQIKDFDYPGAQAMTIRLRVYGPSASVFFLQYSEVEITFNQYVDPSLAPVNITIPFSIFTAAGDHTVSGFAAKSTLSEGGAVASDIGALELQFEGRAIDLVAGLLATNGRCGAVPNASGTVLDECGVCLDDTANANKGKDACGICYKGPPGYDYDLNKVFDACGLCPSHPQYSYPLGNKDACGLCPTEPNWGKSKDPCGVCFGDGSTCADCSGTPNGTAKLDQCNVCGGDGTTCLDCKGVPFGTSKDDVCGVCGGDGTSCKDCAGVINGSSKVDVCGVCGGSATDLLSCSVGALRCVIVKATDDVRKFERQLATKARKLRSRYMAERARSKRTGCKIATKESDDAVAGAFRHIVARSTEIFSAGVEVCGDSCITTSYAAQVEALKPQFKILENRAVSLAKKVNSCYTRLGVTRTPQGDGRGVANTVNTVSRDLNNLIEQCKRKKVCPPGAK
jgi:hypothetical protein